MLTDINLRELTEFDEQHNVYRHLTNYIILLNQKTTKLRDKPFQLQSLCYSIAVINMTNITKYKKPSSISAFLVEQGITLTQQRLKIATFLFQKEQHVSADQILSCINQKEEVVSKATVYNTLGLFAKKGLLREIIVDPSKVFYDTNTHHHHHFYNTDTCSLSDIENSDIAINQLPQLPEGTNIESVNVIIKISNK